MMADTEICALAVLTRHVKDHLLLMLALGRLSENTAHLD
jgi:hypothetical protein